jgi:hypothetical protein
MSKHAEIASRQIETILIGVFLAVVIGFSIPPLVNELRKIRHGEDGTKDYPLWYDTGWRELHGISPYYLDRNREFPFMYPPGAAVLLAPLTVLGRFPMVLMLVLLNSVAWATCIVAPVYLVSGKIRGQPHVVYWLPSLICCVFIWDTYLEGQCAFGLSACLLGMLVCLKDDFNIPDAGSEVLRRAGFFAAEPGSSEYLRTGVGRMKPFLYRQRKAIAGLLLALAAGFKGFPILALPYLIYRQQWKALASTILFLFILLFALPACFRGPRGAIDDFRAWRGGMLSSNTETKMTATGRGERSYTWQNGSVMAVAHRWLRHVKGDTDSDSHDRPLPPMYVNVADLPLGTVNKIADAAIVLLGIFYLAILPLGQSRTRFTTAAEGAMLLILIILVSPMSFTYNTSWLMCGIAVVLFHITTRSNGKPLIPILWLLLALFPLIFSVSTTDPNWRYLRALGNTFFADLILLFELGWLIVRAKKDPVLPDGPFSPG